jgi:hypothetical protein
MRSVSVLRAVTAAVVWFRLRLTVTFPLLLTISFRAVKLRLATVTPVGRLITLFITAVPLSTVFPVLEPPTVIPVPIVRSKI